VQSPPCNGARQAKTKAPDLCELSRGFWLDYWELSFSVAGGADKIWTCDPLTPTIVFTSNRDSAFVLESHGLSALLCPFTQNGPHASRLHKADRKSQTWTGTDYRTYAIYDVLPIGGDRSRMEQHLAANREHRSSCPPAGFEPTFTPSARLGAARKTRKQGDFDQQWTLINHIIRDALWPNSGQRLACRRHRFALTFQP
jgi:hypothetical protein